MARIADLRRGDLVKVDCAAGHHVVLLTPEVLLRTELSPTVKVLDLKARLQCPADAEEGARFDREKA